MCNIIRPELVAQLVTKLMEKRVKNFKNVKRGEQHIRRRFTEIKIITKTQG